MIGIVGGVGPLAGMDVFKKITEETAARSDQEHASVLLFSFPGEIPDRTEYLLGKEKTNPAYALAEILLKLEKAGANVAGIPCNTAHAPQIFDVIEQELQKQQGNIRLLNMISEVVDYILEKFSFEKIGVLSTTGTKEAGIYKDALAAAKIEIVAPDDEWQERIHDAIYNKEYGLKAFSSPVTRQAKSETGGAIEHLIKKGAQAVILGCTELPLAFSEKTYNEVPLFDPNRVLARALLANAGYSLKEDKD